MITLYEDYKIEHQFTFSSFDTIGYSWMIYRVSLVRSNMQYSES